MDIAKLKAEITDDPLGRGYSEMTDAEIATSLNTVNREVNKTLMTASEVLNAIDITEWNALTDAAQQKIWDVLHIGEINPFGIEATIFVAVFGGGSATITALAAVRKTIVSRATELGLGITYTAHVTQARAYHV